MSAPYTLRRVATGDDYPSDTLPTYDNSTQPGAWIISEGGHEMRFGANVESDFKILNLPPTYPDLTQNGFMALAEGVGVLDSTKLVAISTDTTHVDVTAFWIKFRAAVSISYPDNSSPSGIATIEGLAALVAAGHITQADSDSIKAHWPT